MGEQVYKQYWPQSPKINPPLKLYVWCDPYPVPYGSSMVFAVAKSAREARKQVQSGKAYAFGKYEQDRVPSAKLGKPDRVVKLPCAEWHEWSE